jgi:hypothetical protein
VGLLAEARLGTPSPVTAQPDAVAELGERIRAMLTADQELAIGPGAKPTP